MDRWIDGWDGWINGWIASPDAHRPSPACPLHRPILPATLAPCVAVSLCRFVTVSLSWLPLVLAGIPQADVARQERAAIAASRAVLCGNRRYLIARVASEPDCRANSCATAMAGGARGGRPTSCVWSHTPTSMTVCERSTSAARTIDEIAHRVTFECGNG